jgi:hypothetical protein
MARAVKSAAKPRTSKPKAAVPASATARDALQALHDAHGAAVDLPALEAFVPGARLSLVATTPQSIERFVADARAHPLVQDVQVLATHIALTVTIPLEG